jgi:hypothetical protein
MRLCDMHLKICWPAAQNRPFAETRLLTSSNRLNAFNGPSQKEIHASI